MGAGDNDARIEVLSPAALPSRDPLCVPHEAKRSIRIFVVENDRALRDGLASMLGADGYEVTTAGSSSEALEALKRRSFDIVVTDLYLTPVSGMEVISDDDAGGCWFDRFSLAISSQVHDGRRAKCQRGC